MFAFKLRLSAKFLRIYSALSVVEAVVGGDKVVIEIAGVSVSINVNNTCTCYELKQ